MKTEVFTTILAGIVGVFVGYFVANLLMGEIKPVTVNTVDSNISSDLADPDPEIFNYKAIDPTVEVYVGSCAEYGENGECADQVTADELREITDQGNQ